MEILLAIAAFACAAAGAWMLRDFIIRRKRGGFTGVRAQAQLMLSITFFLPLLMFLARLLGNQEAFAQLTFLVLLVGMILGAGLLMRLISKYY